MLPIIFFLLMTLSNLAASDPGLTIGNQPPVLETPEAEQLVRQIADDIITNLLTIPEVARVLNTIYTGDMLADELGKQRIYVDCNSKIPNTLNRVEGHAIRSYDHISLVDYFRVVFRSLVKFALHKSVDVTPESANVFLILMRSQPLDKNVVDFWSFYDALFAPYSTFISPHSYCDMIEVLVVLNVNDLNEFHKEQIY